jgi:hypothetical protein
MGMTVTVFWVVKTFILPFTVHTNFLEKTASSYFSVIWSWIQLSVICKSVCIYETTRHYATEDSNAESHLLHKDNKVCSFYYRPLYLLHRKAYATILTPSSSWSCPPYNHHTFFNIIMPSFQLNTFFTIIMPSLQLSHLLHHNHALLPIITPSSP